MGKTNTEAVKGKGKLKSRAAADEEDIKDEDYFELEEERPVKKRMKKGKDLKKPKIQFQQQKCTLESFRSLIDSVKDKVPERSWDILKTSCFWPMIEHFKKGNVTISMVQKQSVDLEIILKYHKKNLTFDFDGTIKEITEKNVADLFGLPIEGEGELPDIKAKAEQGSCVRNAVLSKYKDFRFKETWLTRAQVAEVLQHECSDDKLVKNSQSIAAFILAHLLGSFFLSKVSTNIGWDLINLCLNMDEVNKINWTKVVRSMLSDGLNKKTDKEVAIYLNGCSSLVLYWFLEETAVSKKISGLEKETPNFVRWSTKKIFNVDNVLHNSRYVPNLIKVGTLKEKEFDEDTIIKEITEIDERKYTGSFQDWIPIGETNILKDNEELNERMRGIIREIGVQADNETTEEKLKKMQLEMEELHQRHNRQTEVLMCRLSFAEQLISELDRKYELQKRVSLSYMARLHKFTSNAQAPSTARTTPAAQRSSDIPQPASRPISQLQISKFGPGQEDEVFVESQAENATADSEGENLDDLQTPTKVQVAEAQFQAMSTIPRLTYSISAIATSPPLQKLLNEELQQEEDEQVMAEEYMNLEIEDEGVENVEKQVVQEEQRRTPPFILDPEGLIKKVLDETNEMIKSPKKRALEREEAEKRGLEKEEASNNTIEKHVKLNKRPLTLQDPNYEYETPEEVKNMEIPKRRKMMAGKIRSPKEPQTFRITYEKKGKGDLKVLKLGGPVDVEERNNVIVDGINCETETWRGLSEELALHYKEFFETTKTKVYPYWSNETGLKILSRESLKMVIEHQEIDSDTIEIYIDLIKEEMQEKQIKMIKLFDLKPAFYTIAQWQYDTMRGEAAAEGKRVNLPNYEEECEKEMMDALWNNFDNDLIIFPLHHAINRHYTFLAVDTKKKEIRHLNPLRITKPGMKKTYCQYYSNAEKVFDYIKRFLKIIQTGYEFEENKDIDKENEREYCRGRNDKGNLYFGKKDLTDREKAVRHFVLQRKLTPNCFKMIEDRLAPQQKPNTYDCGAFILMYIESYVYNVKPTQEDGQRMRIKMIEKFAAMEGHWLRENYDASKD